MTISVMIADDQPVFAALAGIGGLAARRLRH